ncbi:unannotated protein [freshwater metagenome]|uniref:Unannotated protein n=1 Tax=freshwater metagenome TaxID=449393 RepID=A0A6J7HIQ3_9ZZZZ
MPTRSAAAVHSCAQPSGATCPETSSSPSTAPGSGSTPPTRRVPRPASGQPGCGDTVSTTTSGWASSAETGRLSVGRPTTTTRSGRCAAAQDAAPSSSTAPRTEPVPPQVPLLGSPSTGQPRCAATTEVLRPRETGASPATTRVRRARPGARVVGAGALTTIARGPLPGAASVHGAPSARPAQTPDGRAGRGSCPSGSSGSRSARFRCTGPGSPDSAPVATRTARAATERQYRFCGASRPSSGTPRSAAHRTAPP